MRRFLRVVELSDGTVPKRRHQTGLSEQTNFSEFLEVKNDSTGRGGIAQDTHHAIAAGIGVAHDARIARNHENSGIWGGV
jgi:hypothetical protein